MTAQSHQETLSHETATGLFSAYVDAELPPPDERLLEDHLGRCESCREEYDRFATAVALVRGSPRTRPAGDFTSRVVKRTKRARRRELGLQGASALLATRFPVEAAVPILLAVAVALMLVMMAP